MRKPNGYGSIIKMGGNRRKPYAARITVSYSTLENGTKKQKYKNIGYYKTHEEAEIALAEFNKEPYDIDMSKITFEELYNQYLEVNKEYITLSSLKQLKNAFNHCKSIHKRPICLLKFSNYQRVINECKLSYSTKSKIKYLINVLCKYAHRNNILKQNFAEYLKVGKKEKVSMVLFNYAEIEYIEDKSKDDLIYDIALILLYTGLRINELLLIKKSNVFIKNKYMIGGSKTEAGKDRIIPIHDKIVSSIQHHLDSPGTYLITDPKTNGRIPYSSFRYNWLKKPILKAFKTHTTRHTFISGLHASGVPEITIKFIVGHAQSGITSQVYMHKQVDELRYCVNKLDYSHKF